MSKEQIPIYRRFCRKLVYLTAPLWSDKLYLKMYFWCNLGYKLNLKNPRTFNEKLTWLKIYDRHKEYSRMVDKKEAKDYVASIIGEEYIIPTLAIYDKAEDIDFDRLPDQFVLKCTHDSGGVVVCKDKSKLDKAAAIEKLRQGLKANFVSVNREYPYKNVIPRIIAEQYMEDESGFELKDYKIFCFNGEPKMFFIASDRQLGETKFDFFDLEWNHLPIQQEYPNNPNGIPKPKNLEGLLDVARTLSKGFPHLRVDLYNCNGKIYFGELTFFHNSGLYPWNPKEWDYKLGDWLKLPERKS